MNHSVYEKFLSHSERGKATNELACQGKSAIPILKALFNGTAKNKNGVCYNKIGTLGCAYVTVSMLGDQAKSLENYVREGIEQSNEYAIQAIGSFSTIEKETVIALANALNKDIVSEASYSLAKCNESKNKIVLEILKNNSKAIERLKHAEQYINKTT